ncbi:16S rRNA (cytidine(1402)-2'-O)-methyltransferase [Bertholletia excelsa]
MVKLCVNENIPIIPIPGPSAFVAALFASGLATEEFTLGKHARSRRERLVVSANELATQIFFIPLHKLNQFIEEASSIFGDYRQCVMAREITKIHEEFWRGTLREAKDVFSTHPPRGEITFLIEGKANCKVEIPSEFELENELRELIDKGHNLSKAVKLVAERTSVRKKPIYSLALRKFASQKFGKQIDDDN